MKSARISAGDSPQITAQLSPSSHHSPSSNLDQQQVEIASSSSKPNKYKSYLIDKLLKENSPPSVGGTLKSGAGIVSSLFMDNIFANNKNGSQALFVAGNENMPPPLVPSTSPPPSSLNTALNIDAVHDDEDIASEAGTYTIDNSVDVAAVEADFNDDKQTPEQDRQPIQKQRGSATVTITRGQQQQQQRHQRAADEYEENKENMQMHDSNASSLVLELISARAAIDEKFGIVKRPLINDSAETMSSSTVTPSETASSLDASIKQVTSKRPIQKIVRARNKTYSLTRDLLTKDNHISTEPPTEPDPYSFATIESENENRENTGSAFTACGKMTKTSTYQIIAEKPIEPGNAQDNYDQSEKNHDLIGDEFSTARSLPSGVESTSTTKKIPTELLFGTTEKLIEHLNKKAPEAWIISNTTQADPSQQQLANQKLTEDILFMDSQRQPQLQQQQQQIKINRFKKFNNNNDNPGEINNLSINMPSNENNSLGLVMQSQKVANNGISFDFILDQHNRYPNGDDTKRRLPSTNTSRSLAMENSSTTSNSAIATTASNQNNSTNMLNNGVRSYESAVAPTVKKDRNKIDDSCSSVSSHSTSSNSSASSSLSSSSFNANLAQNSPKSNASTGLSLGAKIQNKAKENHNVPPSSSGVLSLTYSQYGEPITGDYNDATHSLDLQSSIAAKKNNVSRRASENSMSQSTIGISSKTTTAAPVANNNSISTSQYANRTLYLRQQSAKAKRDSLERPRNEQVNGINGILKKNTNTSTAGVSSSLLNKSPATLSNNNLIGSGSRSSSIKKSSTGGSTISSSKPSRSNSRNASPNLGKNRQSTGSNLMTGSLSLPSGASLNNYTANGVINNSTNDSRDSFYRRKNYDPLRAVEQEKLRKQHQQHLLRNKKLNEQEQQSKQQLHQQQQMYNFSESVNQVEALNGGLNYNFSLEQQQQYLLEDDSNDDASFTIPIKKLTANVSNKQVINKI
jgi:trimeric autotransporter adhesin